MGSTAALSASQQQALREKSSLYTQPTGSTPRGVLSAFLF